MLRNESGKNNVENAGCQCEFISIVLLKLFNFHHHHRHQGRPKVTLFIFSDILEPLPATPINFHNQTWVSKNHLKTFSQKYSKLHKLWFLIQIHKIYNKKITIAFYTIFVVFSRKKNVVGKIELIYIEK